MKYREKFADFNGINHLQLSKFPVASLVLMAYLERGALFFQVIT